jgi:hypothetical protein
MILLGYPFLAEFFSSKECTFMMLRSLNIRSLVLGAAMAAVATYMVASPLSVPPVPQTNPSVIASASPLSVPPVPQTNPSVIASASPLSVPPVPQTNPSVTA